MMTLLNAEVRPSTSASAARHRRIRRFYPFITASRPAVRSRSGWAGE